MNIKLNMFYLHVLTKKELQDTLIEEVHYKIIYRGWSYSNENKYWKTLDEYTSMLIMGVVISEFSPFPLTVLKLLRFFRFWITQIRTKT